MASLSPVAACAFPSQWSSHILTFLMLLFLLGSKVMRAMDCGCLFVTV